MNIIKRDGREVKFDKSKIEDALIKAYYATRDHNESEEKQNEFKRYTEKVSAFIEFNANISNTVYTDEGKFEPLFADKDTDSSTMKMKPHPTNCANCGAVLKDYKCEYCGTEYPRY